MKDFKWLHFSDLHLSCDTMDADTAKNKMIEFIKKKRELNDLEYNYIFISGDIANKAIYKGTKEFLEKLFFALGLKNNKKDLRKVFWAVGNHDILKEDGGARYEYIKKIRDPDDAMTFENCMNENLEGNMSKRTELVDTGMRLFKNNYSSILKREHEAKVYNPHIFYDLDELNLIVLNTCLTSIAEQDPHNLYIKSRDLNNIFSEIKDKNKPTFVLGHHGRDFFAMEDMDELSDIFDDNNVDVYLCGHNHRLGFALFPDAERDIYQITCGGGDNFKNGAVFSFIHGEFYASDRTIHMTPYSYRESGDKRWDIDERLNRRFKTGVSYPLQRLVVKKDVMPEITNEKIAEKEVAAVLDCDFMQRCKKAEYWDKKNTAVANLPNESCFVNILHLSDLQFGITPELSDKSPGAIRQRETMLENKLIRHLNEIPKEWKPDIVVASGDLAWRATRSDYMAFGRWLKNLLNALNVPMENVILCTGNHDINLDAAIDNSYLGKVTWDKVKEELVPRASEDDIFKKFNEFISFCKGEVDSEIVIKPLSNDLPENSDGKYLYGFRDVLGIRFNVLNTSWYCGTKRKDKSSIPDKENLWIGKEFVYDLRFKLEKNDKFSVTVFHHPFDWLNPAEGDDNASVKKSLLAFSDIILCGHVHTRIGEPTFEHNRTQIFQSGALWTQRGYEEEYIYESRIIRINKQTGAVEQLTLEYSTGDEIWVDTFRKGPNRDHSYPINFTKHPDELFG